MLTLWREYWMILERIIVSSPFAQVAIKTHAHHFVTRSRAHKFAIRAHDFIIFFKCYLSGFILSCIFCWQVFPHNIFVYRYRIHSTYMKLIYFNIWYHISTTTIAFWLIYNQALVSYWQLAYKREFDIALCCLNANSHHFRECHVKLIKLLCIINIIIQNK